MNAVYSEYYISGTFENFIKKFWILDNLNNGNPILQKGVPPQRMFHDGNHTGKRIEGKA
ncbi:hypothetical protein CHA01nite_18000 [Chryseobacterium hagamense]|uniref:Uncharacterized protein n=1 Tax=Chryseobacterium hagamense TaxID=395935 RepID=A0A511YLM3_9FLAO|nr:hypothetical protein CHA01nite_18000 [Chryseobacterium hagamense]